MMQTMQIMRSQSIAGSGADPPGCKIALWLAKWATLLYVYNHIHHYNANYS